MRIVLRLARNHTCLWRKLLNTSVRRFSQEFTHFGYEEVSVEDKAKRVHKVFSNVAQSYDDMNDAMSFGIHRLWKDTLIQQMNPGENVSLLDVAGGTGDIAFRFLNYKSPSGNECARKVTVYDINQDMLNVGKERAKQNGVPDRNISWVCGDAENLPFQDNTFCAYTIAFGIRNCTNIEKVISEAHRVLKPGGRFLCLEFSRVNQPILRRLYDAYSFEIIPVMGEIIAGDWNSYKYLVESIRKFPDQEAFKDCISHAGFKFVDYTNLTFGTVAIHSGFKF